MILAGHRARHAGALYKNPGSKPGWGQNEGVSSTFRPSGVGPTGTSGRNWRRSLRNRVGVEFLPGQASISARGRRSGAFRRAERLT
ncbi:Hypothetical protein I596_1218 [Dokdonella koreensis DS-123]|uniref:Uncharacterized protein n=1 Tax=Dokdonella koreensis DS-123 TaxID=1300342 RepID=A0A160DSH1_9GAMM|nr:Hypothetical protein I596_1218 [Dokdonella koreensis DS-123]